MSKNQRIVLILILLFIQVILAQAQSGSLTETIRGQVTDKQSGYPLIGASVTVVGSAPAIGTVTDIDGYFRLENIPIGRHSIEITYLGYEPRTISNLLLTSSKELEVNVTMEESMTQLSEVVVKASGGKREPLNKMSTVSARTFSVEEASRYAGSAGDPSRMAQNYAGVSGASDDRNDIIIRGNSPLGVLWRLDGIDIPSPNHFSVLGTTGGPVSMLNINNLSNSDFMSSAWSADYGNAISGVFDLRMRNGNSSKSEFLGQIGFNGFELGAEGPISKDNGSSYSINYRYSTLGVFKALGLDFGTGSSTPEYQDVTFKLNIPTKHAGQFSVFGLGGISDISFLAKEADTDSTNLFSDDTQDLITGSNTGVIGASHTYFIDKNTYFKTVLAASGTQSTVDLDSVPSEDNKIKIVNYDHRQFKYAINLKLNKKINAKTNYALGVSGDLFRIKNLDSIIDYESGGYFIRSDFEGYTSLIQAYGNYQHKLNQQLTINVGLHGQYLTLNQSIALEPRLGLKYKFNPKQSVNIGAGLHSQLQPINLYLLERLNDHNQYEIPNKELDFSKSIHTVLGYDWYFYRNMRLKAEVYYQHLYSIPVDTISSSWSMLNQGASFVIPDKTGLNNDGSGQNYGLELTVERFFSKGFYFLSTVSLFQSKYKGSDGVIRDSYYGSNYVINGLVGKEFSIGEKIVLSFDTKLTFAGGRRYTPINLSASNAIGYEVLENDKAFSEQYNPYFRSDLKISFRLNGRRISQLWSVDLQNVTNNSNVFAKGYNNRTKSIGTTYQRGFFPIILYQIYF